MSKGIVVIKESKRPSPGVIESILTVSTKFNITENKVLSLIESGESFSFDGSTYYFDEKLDD